MSEYTLKERLESMGINLALNTIKDDPDKNLPKLMKRVEALDRNDDLLVPRQVIWDILNNQDNHWNRFIKSMWTDIDDEVRNTFFANMILNTLIIGNQRQMQAVDEYGCNIPLALLIDPTSACNLNCTGCWAAEYGNQLNMTYEELDSIVSQGKKLGTFFW